MLNNMTFGSFLIGLGIIIAVVYFVTLAIDTTLAMIIAVSAIVSVICIILSWLGFKVASSPRGSKESDSSEKV